MLAVIAEVALLAEGVDRNACGCRGFPRQPEEVALLAEGVDRNFGDNAQDIFGTGRPPRGGRG